MNGMAKEMGECDGCREAWGLGDTGVRLEKLRYGLRGESWRGEA